MVDLAAKGSEWVRRWQEVTFAPVKLFGAYGFGLDSSAFVFSTGALFIGYFSALGASATYFAIYYRRNFLRHIVSAEFKSTLELLTIIAGIYITAILVALLLTSLISYLLYRSLGSTREFESHFATQLHLFNLEPLAAVALCVFMINRTNGHFVIAGLLFGLFAATRIYYLILAYTALKALHRLSPKRLKLAFYFGYVPPSVLGIIVQIAITWVLGEVATHGLD